MCITFIVVMVIIEVWKEMCVFQLAVFCVSGMHSVNGICFVSRYRRDIEELESV